jgi:two-component system phosphate regulon sensor histidine kinase PhoR
MTLIPQEIFDRLLSAIIVVDDRRRVMHANRSAIDLIGKNALNRDLALSLRHPVILDSLDAVLAGSTEQNGEITIPAPISQSFVFHAERILDTPLSDGSFATLVLDNITSAHKTEEIRASFVANVSHELRSPLTAIIGFIETLQGPASDDANARQRFLNILHRESQRMARLINGLLSLSRVEINEHIAPKDAVDVPRIIQNVMEALQPQATKRGITLSLDAEDNTPVVIADADQLHQVFLNLIENAIKYGGEDNAVKVSTKPVDRVPGSTRAGLSVTIQDQGPGIPKSLIPRLTERFYRIDEARSSTAETGMSSTGLGLAIVKHIINRHRGHMTVQSEIDVGSTFTVFLPAHPDPGSAPR